MKRHHTTRRAAKEAQANSAELSRMSFNLLVRLAHTVAANEKAQHKFRICVLIRLAKIETMLTEVQGCQLADLWQPGTVSDEKRTEYLKEVQERMDLASERMGLKMIRYIYGNDPGPEPRHDRRRRWWGWEI